MPWDDVYAMATPGRVFDMFTNQSHALRTPGDRRPGGTLMLFAGAQAAAALMGDSDEAIIERFIGDLVGLYPEARGLVEEARVWRWPMGNVYAKPGRQATAVGHRRTARPASRTSTLPATTSPNSAISRWPRGPVRRQPIALPGCWRRSDIPTTVQAEAVR